MTDNLRIYLIVTAVCLYITLTLIWEIWRRRRTHRAGHWHPGRRGWKKVQIFIDGRPVMFCVEANVVEGWVRVMRPARPHTLPRGLDSAGVPSLEGLMEPDPVAADGRPLVVRLRGVVTTIP